MSRTSKLSIIIQIIVVYIQNISLFMASELLVKDMQWKLVISRL